MKIGQILADFSGKVIDHLTVINWQGKGASKGDTLWFCKCSCGETCIRSRSFLSSKTKSKKTCGYCVDGKRIIGEVVGSIKILRLEKKHRRSETISELTMAISWVFSRSFVCRLVAYGAFGICQRFKQTKSHRKYFRI